MQSHDTYYLQLSHSGALGLGYCTCSSRLLCGLHLCLKRTTRINPDFDPAMDEPTTYEGKIALIKENLQEVLNEEIIEEVMVKQNRPLVIYWGK